VILCKADTITTAFIHFRFLNLPTIILLIILIFFYDLVDSPNHCCGGKDRFWRRWQRERLQRVIYDDIRDLEQVKEISLLALLPDELPSRVGCPFR
jgi:hypothetical protein